jgi:glycine C-acetyltransferase/8-amino-7-oxononanoate synthase
VIVTDSVFSMDGDVAPLAELVELAKAYDAQTIVDEAHATGVLGPGGRGAVAQAGLQGEVDVVVGTLGKALGSYGAYVCADEEMIRYLINTSRALIFSTAPGPPAVAGALAALELLQERPHRVQRLRSNARVLRRALAAEGMPVEDVEMHIVPLIVGDEHAALSMCEALLQRGVFAQAIRPPTVAAGTSRLRLAVMASHTAEELRDAAGTLAEAARELRLDLTSRGAPAAEPQNLPASGREDTERRPPAFARPIAPMTPSASARATSAPFDGERDVLVHRAA